jgi:hypothetical protein
MKQNDSLYEDQQDNISLNASQNTETKTPTGLQT